MKAVLRLSALALALSFTGCMHNTTPASRTCRVLTDESQLAGCVGKVVTVRGKLSSSKKIAGVSVEAPTELTDRVAHATGTLTAADGGYALRNGDTVARAHSAMR